VSFISSSFFEFRNRNKLLLSQTQSLKGYANKYTIDYMKAKEARFLSFVAQEDLSVLPEAIIIASRHGLVLGRVFTYSPGTTLVEFVGISGKNYDSFVSEANTVIDIRAASNNDIRDAITTAPLPNIPEGCTLALLKPHILRLHKAGEVLGAIQSRGFTIRALFAFHITTNMAEEFFDAYRGIFCDYAAMIENLCSGPVLAVAISHRSSYDTVSDFREFAGPTNPKLAKVLRPESLRARFGSGMLDNVLHCTDLPEDGEMECRYFFETLASIK